MELEGRVAVVLGGAMGIGRAYCEALMGQGVKVVCGDVAVESGAELVSEMATKYPKDRFSFYKCDVTREGQIEGIFQAAKHTMGHPDLLVYSAGIIDEFDWQPCIQVNLMGAISATSVGLKYMSREHGGSGGDIVLTSSICGLRPSIKFPVYASTKYALVGFSRSLGDQAHVDVSGVRINTICPVKIDTGLNDGVRPGKVRVPGYDPAANAKPGLPASIVGDGLIKVLQDKLTAQALLVTEAEGLSYADFMQYPS